MARRSALDREIVGFESSIRNLFDKFYAGIGSRKTPLDVLDLMEQIAVRLRVEDWTLRSGHAPGADQAFERGAAGWAEIFLPWPGFESSMGVMGKTFTGAPERAFELAEQLHPNWAACSWGARKLHARNCQQILGPELDSPVSLVVCWSAGTGGTEQALRIAKAERIPVTNLYVESVREDIEGWLAEIQ